MFENRPEKKCFGVLDEALPFCNDCAIRMKCIVACYEDQARTYGICGICQNFNSIRNEAFCIREEKNDEGEVITVKVALAESPGKVSSCIYFGDNWEYQEDLDEDYGEDEDDEDARKGREDDEEYKKMLLKLFGPSGELYP